MVKFIVNGGKAVKNILISLGLTLIVISMLVFLYPKFFAFIFAGLVGLIGLGALIRGIMSKPQKPQNSGNYGGFGNQTEDGSYQEIDD
jgi:hypothetical protein